MDVPISVERIKHWGLKGGFGILDQGLYSGANFLLNVLLARWFSPEMYGVFAAAYSLYLLISTAQVALIAEPMSIFGADKYKRNTSSYLNYLLRMQWLGSSILTSLLVLIASLFTPPMFRDSLLGMAIALPFILFYWYLRRAFYVEMQSELAMMSSFLYAIAMLLFILGVYYTGHLTSFTAYLVLALGSLVASIFTLRYLGLQFFGKGTSELDLDADRINMDLWDFGKWILLAYIASWFTSLSHPFLITILVDAQSAGVFRALQNLFLPLQQFLAAVTLLLLPWLSRQFSNRGDSRFFISLEIAAAIVALFSVAYCLCIILFRHQILSYLYANEFYASFDRLVVYLAITALLGSGPLILGLGLRILKHQNVILWSKGGAAFCALIVGLPLIYAYKMNGAILSLLGSIVLEATILVFFYLRMRNRTKGSFDSPGSNRDGPPERN